MGDTDIVSLLLNDIRFQLVNKPDLVILLCPSLHLCLNHGSVYLIQNGHTALMDACRFRRKIAIVKTLLASPQLEFPEVRDDLLLTYSQCRYRYRCNQGNIDALDVARMNSNLSAIALIIHDKRFTGHNTLFPYQTVSQSSIITLSMHQRLSITTLIVDFPVFDPLGHSHQGHQTDHDAIGASSS